MPLTLAPLLLDAGVDPAQTLIIRHAFVTEPEESGLTGLHADSTHAEILAYSATQSSESRRFPVVPPRFWVVFIKEGGDQARLWSVVENRGEIARDDTRRTFDISETEHLSDLRSAGYRVDVPAHLAHEWCRGRCLPGDGDCGCGADPVSGV